MLSEQDADAVPRPEPAARVAPEGVGVARGGRVPQEERDEVSASCYVVVVGWPSSRHRSAPQLAVAGHPKAYGGAYHFLIGSSLSKSWMIPIFCRDPH